MKRFREDGSISFGYIIFELEQTLALCILPLSRTTLPFREVDLQGHSAIQENRFTSTVHHVFFKEVPLSDTIFTVMS